MVNKLKLIFLNVIFENAPFTNLLRSTRLLGEKNKRADLRSCNAS